MVKNNKLIETLYKCVKDNSTLGACRGCFYGDGEYTDACKLHLMNDLLFFFGNPVPDPNAYVLSLTEVEDAVSDKKDHLAFAEFISSIHVAKPVIRIVKVSGNFITLYDPQTDETDSFNKNDYYTNVRVWSSKPTDKLRNETKWELLEEMASNDNTQVTRSKTESILNHIQNWNRKA